jgi:[ribosomal protein S5]-alanine N-acetyltransferase
MARLETKRLVLTPFALCDLDFLHALWTEPEVRRFLWDDQVISREQAQEVITSSLASFDRVGVGFWKLVLKADEAPVGFCGLRPFEDAQLAGEQIELLYGLTAKEWGKGLAVEAARTVLQFAFTELGLACVYAGADPPNTASFRLMERLGMSFDHRTTLNGLDAIYYAITRAVWLASAKALPTAASARGLTVPNIQNP